MRLDGSMIAAVFVLLILAVLVGGILYMPAGFWRQCVADTAHARG